MTMTQILAMVWLELAFRKPEAKKLLRKYWLEINKQSNIHSTGFSFVATEALFYMFGGDKTKFTPVCASYSKGTHWWLVDNENNIYDPTKSQYGKDEPPYHLGRECGFQNGYNKPSKRAAALIEIADKDGRYKHITQGIRTCSTT